MSQHPRKNVPRRAALFGLINFSPALFCAEDALGQPIDISVGANKGTLTLPSLPDWTGDPLHKPLLGPLPARTWKRGEDPIEWGEPFSFPTGKGGTVRRGLMQFQARPDNFEIAAQQILKGVPRWVDLFEQYHTLLTAPNTKSHASIVSSRTDRIELLSDDGQGLKPIRSGEPTLVEIYMSSTDESLHFEALKQICQLSSLGLSPCLEYRLMLEAYHARRKPDYRKAVIEAATALEISLTNRALKEFTSQNISFGKKLLNKFRTLNGKFELLRILSIEFPDKDYLNLIVNPRNIALHRGDFLGETLADQVINEVEQLLQLFSPKLHQDDQLGSQ